MEYAQLGTLENSRDLRPAEALSVFRHVLKALTFIHSEDFAHRDLKPVNVLIQSDNPTHVLVSDFGFTGQDPLRTFCGSHRYCASEIYISHTQNIPYVNRVDIWSVGIMTIRYCLPSDCLSEPSPWTSEAWLDIVDRERRQSPEGGWERLASFMLSHDP